MSEETKEVATKEVATKEVATKGRGDRATKARMRLFPSVPVFDPQGKGKDGTRRGGFVPLPIILRPLLRLLQARAWMVLTWIYMRSGKAGVCWFRPEELGHDMGFGSVPKLRTYLKSLQELHLIDRRVERGVEYYVAVEPLHAVRELLKEGKLTPELISDLNEVLDMLGWEELPAAPTKET